MYLAGTKQINKLTQCVILIIHLNVMIMHDTEHLKLISYFTFFFSTSKWMHRRFFCRYIYRVRNLIGQLIECALIDRRTEDIILLVQYIVHLLNNMKFLKKEKRMVWIIKMILHCGLNLGKT